MAYSDLLKLYSKVVKQYPPINDFDEQMRLVLQAKEGRKDAIDRLVLSNMGLVIKIVADRTAKTNYKYGSMEFEDLFQEGNFGLMRALQAYDPEGGTKFSTYAVWWIDRQVRNAMYFQSKPIKLPHQVVERIITISRIEDKLKRVLQREPTEDEVIRAMGSLFDADLVKQTLHLARINNLIDLDVNLSKDGEAGGSLGDLIESEDLSIEETAINNDRDQRILSAVEELNRIEAAAIKIRWGLEDGVEKTLEETAQILFERGITNKQGRKISKQGVDQIEKRAMEKLKPKLKALFPDEGENIEEEAV